MAKRQSQTASRKLPFQVPDRPAISERSYFCRMLLYVYDNFLTLSHKNFLLRNNFCILDKNQYCYLLYLTTEIIVVIFFIRFNQK